MQTPKQIFLELLKPDGHPERELVQYEALSICLADPINGYLRGNRKRGSVTLDRWGTTIAFPEDAPGAIPLHDQGRTVLKDITHWRDYAHAPDLAANCSAGWEEVAAAARAKADAENKLLTGFMGTGIFEQCHFLMGFEDTLTAFYEHPQEMHELIDYITDYRMQYLKLLIDGLHPDAILSHDDWGTKDALFMQPDMWREFFKESYRKFYGYMRDHGVIAIHHADSYLSPIVEDMAEIGIQVWQGVLPENDIPELQARLNGRLVLMGGIGAAIDRPDAQPDEIRQYTKEALERYCPGGHYIPCITYGIPGTVFPHVDPEINTAITEYNSLPHMPVTAHAASPRRVRAAASETQSAAAAGTASADIFEELAEAIRKGRKKKVKELCQKALDQGVDPSDILSRGLVVGMNRLGDDFSANRAFVPEMLMAARCMNEATELLKPLLIGSGAKSLGKVCIGTVKGDMHDIGKNLVKIMLEGSGFDVIDLGADVDPSLFVQTAKEQHCDIISCSALLTTTMHEMAAVVSLAREAGIRDQVKIMIGGAPITQSFCDEIGADCYTSDAAAAARAAVALMQA